MARAHLRCTHTYATLEVKRSTYDDVRERIVALGRDYIDEYIHDYQKPGEVLVLGQIGLIPEPRTKV